MKEDHISAEKLSAQERGKRVLESVRVKQEQQPKHPVVDEHYHGFYANFSARSKEARGLLASSECIIGTRLYPVFEQKMDLPSGDDDVSSGPRTLRLDARNARPLAELHPFDAEPLLRLHDKGWIIDARLSLVVYSEEDKTFRGEAAFICYDPSCKIPLENFAKNIVRRIGGGEHPGLSLSQEQFNRVLDSNGAWYLTKAVPLPEREQGEVIFKRHRSWSDVLVEAAVEGNVGCKFASIAFWVALALLAIWFFFLR